MKDVLVLLISWGYFGEIMQRNSQKLLLTDEIWADDKAEASGS